jgi:DNA repair protein RecO (recombination protein O)
MIYKTRGIALHTIKYGDTSIVAHVYTEQFGKQAYLVKGARSKNAKVKSNLFYPLNLLEMEVYHKDGSNLQKVKEIHNAPVYHNLPLNPEKNAIALFLAELLYRTLKEVEQNPRLFEFIFNASQLLDLVSANFSDFHIVFMLQLAKFGGFYPNNNFSDDNQVFDLLNGSFIPSTPLHGHNLFREDGKAFSRLIDITFDKMNTIKLNRNQRQYFLEKLVEFYQLHVEGMSHVKSLKVLKEVFG